MRSQRFPPMLEADFRQCLGHGRVVGISRLLLPPERLVLTIQWMFSGLAEIAGAVATVSPSVSQS